MSGCGAPDQSVVIEGVDTTTETVLSGKVFAEGAPVGGAYVRLLDSTGEFTAEVVTSPQGVFRFFAAPGSWTLRALSRHGNGDLVVDASRGVNEVGLGVAA